MDAPVHKKRSIAAYELVIGRPSTGIMLIFWSPDHSERSANKLPQQYSSNPEYIPLNMHTVWGTLFGFGFIIVLSDFLKCNYPYSYESLRRYWCISLSTPGAQKDMGKPCLVPLHNKAQTVCIFRGVYPTYICKTSVCWTVCFGWQ